MRTNIEIDDDLMRSAAKSSGLKTKREIVEHALRLMVQMKRQAKIKLYRGKLKWEGNLPVMRRGRK